MQCPVCSADGQSVRFELVRTSTGEVNEIKICRQCTVLYNASLFDKLIAGTIDNAEHQVASAVNAYAIPHGEEGLRLVQREIDGHRFIVDLAKRFVGPVEGKSILEVGFGPGFGLLAAASAFRSVTGVELGLQPFEEVCRISPKPENLTVVTDFSQVSEKADVVVGWHVLEHLPDPINFLTLITRHMQPGGIVMFQVPMFRTPYVESVHFVFYNENSFNELMKRLSISTVELMYDFDNAFLTFVGRYLP